MFGGERTKPLLGGIKICESGSVHRHGVRETLEGEVNL